ncbi:sulfotransferase [Elysia marginata]|uniref:Sulfotransferase n=1 Tax=Elysia marginata TaxID=1093978 RepID=A0AAV4JXW2_9GAST|nr:sulfotransferase [Elysia marginata]
MTASGADGETFKFSMTNYRVLNILILVSLLGLMFDIALRYSATQKSLRVIISQDLSGNVDNQMFPVEKKVPFQIRNKLKRIEILKSASENVESETPVHNKSQRLDRLKNVSLDRRFSEETKIPPLDSNKNKSVSGDVENSNSSSEKKVLVQNPKKLKRIEILKNDSVNEWGAAPERILKAPPRQQRKGFLSWRKRKRRVHATSRSRGQSSANDDDDAQSPSSQEKEGKDNRDREMKPRPPKCLIVGFSKCGTEALKGFLTLHPDIVAPFREVDFFTNYYYKGLDWYRKQMPPSMASQITIEKTPEYILTREVLHRIRDYNSDMRLIVMIRDPIVRLQSLYLHDLVHKPEYSADTTFKQWCGGGGRTAHVASVVDYASHIRDAFDIFSRRQVLVQSEEELENSPIKVLRTVESFLGLRRAFSKDNIFYSGDKGFYCFNVTTSTFSKASKSTQMNKSTGCFTDSKGRPHQKIAPGLLKELVEFTRPYNERLFQLLGRTYTWKNFS